MKTLSFILLFVLSGNLLSLSGPCIICQDEIKTGFCLLESGSPVGGSADCISWESVYEVFSVDDIPPEWFTLPACDWNASRFLGACIE